MIAINQCLGGNFDRYKVYIADKYILRVEPKAKYYIPFDTYTSVLIPLEKPLLKYEKGELYTLYSIDKYFYDSYIINKYSELVEFYSEEKQKYTQLSLFKEVL